MPKFSFCSRQRCLIPLFFKALLFIFLLKEGRASRLTIPNYNLGAVSLDPQKTGFTIGGEAGSGQFGFSVNTAGDIDGDGYDDLIVGALSRNAAYVIYGGEKTSLSNLDLSIEALDPATTGFIIRGKGGDYLGVSVSTAGDINNDGYADIIMGGYGQNTERGAVYVIYGAKRSLLSNIDLNYKTLDPATTGFMIKGKGTKAKLGLSVSRAGDVNKDGYDDIVFSAPGGGGNNGETAAYVIYGGEKSSFSNIDLSSTVLDPATTGFSVIMPSGIVYFACSVSTAGDVDKDGYDDIIIGSNNIVYVIYGGEKSSLSNIVVTSSPTITPATAGFWIFDNTANTLGSSVSTAGDIDKDGYDDIVFGDYFRSSNQGFAYVIYGKERSLISNINLGSQTLDPSTTGFTIKGYDANNNLGISVSAAGDINKDGYDDIIIGASKKDASTGEAYVIYGREKSSFVNINLDSMTLDPATTGFTITGAFYGDKFGYSVSSAGDINKDGYVDFIIGANGKNGNRGQALVFHSSLNFLLI